MSAASAECARFISTLQELERLVLAELDILFGFWLCFGSVASGIALRVGDGLTVKSANMALERRGGKWGLGLQRERCLRTCLERK